MDSKALLMAMVKDFSTKMQKKNIQAFAASTAFFLIVSLIPLLIMLSSLLPYTKLTEANLIKVLTDLTPDFGDGIVTSLISEAYDESIAVFSISALVTIWTGASGILSLIRGLNFIYDVDEYRNYFYLRLIAALYTVAMFVIVLAMLTLNVFGNLVRDILTRAFPKALNVISFLVNFKFIVAIGVAILLFALIYTFVQSAKMKFLFQLPGAIVSAVAWYGFSSVFSIYVNLAGGNSVYGSLATPVFMMFWLYICIYIFLIGAFLNRFFHPAVKHIYEIQHMKTVKKNVKKKSTKVIRKPKNNEFR